MGRLRFGIFDFDPATKQLRREGTPVRLEAQPAQMAVARKARWSRVAILALFAVLEGGLIVIVWREWNKPPATAPAATLKVAVSRFDNETGNPDLDRFTNALADSVVANLTTSGSGRYGVIGNAAILRRPRDQRDLKAIAASLSAGYVVLGQVQQEASRIRVLAHLIHLPEQTHIWVTRVDCDPSELLVKQSEIAQRIGAEFSDRLRSSPAAATQ